MGWRKRLFSRSAVSAFFVSSLVSCAIALLFLYPIQDAGHVAAWVQALGSIGVLVGMYWSGRNLLQTEIHKRALFKSEKQAERNAIQFECISLIRDSLDWIQSERNIGGNDSFRLRDFYDNWYILECGKAEVILNELENTRLIHVKGELRRKSFMRSKFSFECLCRLIKEIPEMGNCTDSQAASIFREIDLTVNIAYGWVNSFLQNPGR